MCSNETLSLPGNYKSCVSRLVLTSAADHIHALQACAASGVVTTSQPHTAAEQTSARLGTFQPAAAAKDQTRIAEASVNRSKARSDPAERQPVTGHQPSKQLASRPLEAPQQQARADLPVGIAAHASMVSRTTKSHVSSCPAAAFPAWHLGARPHPPKDISNQPQPGHGCIAPAHSRGSTSVPASGQPHPMAACQQPPAAAARSLQPDEEIPGRCHQAPASLLPPGEPLPLESSWPQVLHHTAALPCSLVPISSIQCPCTVLHAVWRQCMPLQAGPSCSRTDHSCTRYTPSRTGTHTSCICAGPAASSWHLTNQASAPPSARSSAPTLHPRPAVPAPLLGPTHPTPPSLTPSHKAAPFSRPDAAAAAVRQQQSADPCTSSPQDRAGQAAQPSHGPSPPQQSSSSCAGPRLWQSERRDAAAASSAWMWGNPATVPPTTQSSQPLPAVCPTQIRLATSSAAPSLASSPPSVSAPMLRLASAAVPPPARARSTLPATAAVGAAQPQSAPVHHLPGVLKAPQPALQLRQPSALSAVAQPAMPPMPWQEPAAAACGASASQAPRPPLSSLAPGTRCHCTQRANALYLALLSHKADAKRSGLHVFTAFAFSPTHAQHKSGLNVVSTTRHGQDGFPALKLGLHDRHAAWVAVNACACLWHDSPTATPSQPSTAAGPLPSYQV